MTANRCDFCGTETEPDEPDTAFCRRCVAVLSEERGTEFWKDAS